jgi:ferrous iron transport protein A
MQLSVNKKRGSRASRSTTLDKLKTGEAGVLDRLDLPNDIARRLMELGFLPGHTVVPARSAPGGEPRVYRVDGSEIALRRETASRLHVTPRSAEK